ncbi:MAG: hypothetical protein WC682_04715 [Parcubacteria group bacterium]|jgi:hypothetical protein
MPQKKQIKLETDINEIVIVNNKKLAPYIELVNFSSQNIDQKKLGTILGIFEIKDTSEDSAYIVNFLSSVAKKTYFASHQKNPEESFESTLAKVNSSLSEVAKHGNVNWIGKIDAVLCSVFENQINFSVSGDAKVLLLRNSKLTEISSGLSPKDEAANPLKTFTDIASGRLEFEDKLIITTDDISHVFTLDDLEKYTLSFSKDKFLRFLETALVNELDIAGTIVIDTKKTLLKTKEKSDKKTKPDSEFNLFGSTAFEEKSKSQEIDSVADSLSDKTPNKKEYTHEKTGHIYVTDSGENYKGFREDKVSQMIDNFKEKLSDLKYWLKERYVKKGSYKIKKSFVSLFKKEFPSKIPVSKEYPLKKVAHKSPILTQHLKEISSQIKDKSKSFSLKNPLKNKVIFKTKSATSQPTESSSDIRLNRKESYFFIDKIKKQLINFLKLAYSTIIIIANSVKKFLPQFSKIKFAFLKMNLKLKIIVLAIIIAIFVVPLFIFLKKDSSKSAVTTTSDSSISEDMSINPSSQFYNETSELYKSDSLIGTFIFNNIVFAVSKNRITQLENTAKEYNLPGNFGDTKYYSFMSDLNLLFLMNANNQLISFSPISLKFKDESIAIKDDAQIEGIGTYLTYIYLVDSQNKQIYRYPRADNGFGEKIDWLQSDINFENIIDLTIDGNVYLAKNDNIIKLFNRKVQNFSLKKDENSSINGIFTSDDTSSLYVLDNLNGELDKFDKEGNKKSFVSNQNLTKATRVWADEKNSSAYFVSDNTLFKINLPK